MATSSRVLQFSLRLIAVLAALASVVASAPAGAVVGGYVEVHVLVCPPGYTGDNPFRDCHSNRLAGVGLVAEGPGPRHYEDVTSSDGRVVFGDFLEGGAVTIAQAKPTGEFASYQVYCSRVDNQAPIAVERRGDGRAAVVFTLPNDIVSAGSGVVCDWFNIPAATIEPTVGPGHEAPDGGLGLTRADWEQIHGKGTASGATFTYENGNYAVAFTDGVVTFIEIGWEAQGGVSAADANAAVAHLIPVDAVVTGTATLPAPAAGPIALVVQRLHSDTLAAWLEGRATGSDGGIVIVYQVQAPQGNAEPMIFRVSLAIERAPS